MLSFHNQNFRSNFFRQCDAEVITGYNIVNFDLPYLMNRAEVLGVKAFPFLGKILNSKTTMRSSQLSSSAFGTHESKDFSMDGRVIMDMLQVGLVRRLRAPSRWIPVLT